MAQPSLGESSPEPTEIVARELLKALNDASQSARTSWLFFITLMAYLFVAVASVTHTDLLLNAPAKLPILQFDIPLVGFLLYGPILFVVVHFGVLLHHATLVHKAAALNKMLQQAESGGARSHPLRMELSSYFFTQYQAGPDRGAIWQFLLRAMVFLTLDLLPLCLLFYCQVAYLPAHDADVTFFHRVYISLDVAVLLAIRIVLRNSEGWTSNHFSFALRTFSAGSVLAGITWPSILFLAFCVATLPSSLNDRPGMGPDLDRLMTRLWPTKVPFDRYSSSCKEWLGDRCAFWLTSFLLEQPIDYVSGRRPWFSRNLVVADKTFLPSHSEQYDQIRFSLRGRDLRYATFDRSNLRRIDLTAVDLSGASLKGADLRDAVLGCAIKGRKIVAYVDGNGRNQFLSQDEESCPVLVGANLSEAKLSNLLLNKSDLRGIIASQTDFRGFDFRNINLTGARLTSANIRGVDFTNANLDGASLANVKAEGASFIHASLRGADLQRAHLDGANLENGDLSGARLSDASMFAANMTGAFFFGANLIRARVWESKPSISKAYTLAFLHDLDLDSPSEEDIKRLNEAGATLKSVVTAPIDGQNLIDTILGGGGKKQWSDRKAENTWRSMAETISVTPTAKEDTGRYLGDLACADEGVLRGILRTHFLIFGYNSFESYYVRDEKVLVPPTVTKKDLEGIRRTYDYGWSDYTSIGYDVWPVLLTAFYVRVTGPECPTINTSSPALVKEIEEAIGRAEKLSKEAAAKAKQPTQ